MTTHHTIATPPNGTGTTPFDATPAVRRDRTIAMSPAHARRADRTPVVLVSGRPITGMTARTKPTSATPIPNAAPTTSDG
jgi:hypothetical protein